jgi:hypothetical protein
MYNTVTCIPIGRQRLGKHVRAVKNAPNNRRAVFYMWSAPRPLLCNGAVNTTAQKQRGCVSCVVR